MQTCYPKRFVLDLHNAKGGGLLYKVKEHIGSSSHRSNQGKQGIDKMFAKKSSDSFKPL